MVSKTSGGLVKFSLAMTEAMVADLDENAEERGVSRSDVIRDWLERGKRDYRREQVDLETLHALRERTAV